MTDRRAAALAPKMVTRLVVFAFLWWIIAQGQTSAWLIGLPAVALAAVSSVYLSRVRLPGFSLVGMLRFSILFLRESVRGGMDVARRTLAPRLRIRPGFRRYQMQLTDPLARILLINCISLLPGTLSAQVDGDSVELHLLNAGDDPSKELFRLEQSIARLYGLSLEVIDV